MDAAATGAIALFALQRGYTVLAGQVEGVKLSSRLADAGYIIVRQHHRD